MATKANVKNKQSNSKLKSAITWLKPTTPAKGMLLFAIVFAVIGGGYMAYKSFASSHFVVQYPGNKEWRCTGNCSTNFIDESGELAYTKDKRRATRLNDNSASLSTRFYFDISTQPRQAKICAEVRSTAGRDLVGTDVNFSMDIVGGDPAQYIIGQKHVLSQTQYQYKCTNYALTIPAGSHMLHATVWKSGANNALYISSLSLDTP